MNLKLHNQKSNTWLNKLVSVLLSFLMLIPICGAVSYVGSCNGANLSAEREVRPGYSYVVRLIMDSAATGYEGYFSYDTSVLTLTRVVPVNSDLYTDFRVTTETGYVRVTHSESVHQMLQLTFMVDERAKIGTEAMIRFHSGSVINGTTSESVADVSFRFKIVERKSSDATLRGIDVSVYRSLSDRDQNTNGFMASLAPSFSASNTMYSLTVANEFSYFRVVATPNDSTATVISVSDGELTEGKINTVNVIVQAEDGTQKTYVLQIFRERSFENSIDVSDPVSDDPSEEPPESSSEQSFENSSLDTSSEIDDSAGAESEESDLSSEDSFLSEEGSSDTESLDESSDIEDKEESHETDSDTKSSLPSPLSSVHASSDGSGIDTRNWTGVFFCIAAVSVLAIAVLLIRILVLFYKKKFKSN